MELKHPHPTNKTSMLKLNKKNTHQYTRVLWRTFTFVIIPLTTTITSIKHMRTFFTHSKPITAFATTMHN